MINEPSLEEARAIVATALGLSLQDVGTEDRLHKLRNWDSLGQVCIVLAIEQKLGVEITDETTFMSLTSVRGIAQYLQV